VPEALHLKKRADISQVYYFQRFLIIIVKFHLIAVPNRPSFKDRTKPRSGQITLDQCKQKTHVLIKEFTEESFENPTDLTLLNVRGVLVVKAAAPAIRERATASFMTKIVSLRYVCLFDEK